MHISGCILHINVGDTRNQGNSGTHSFFSGEGDSPRTVPRLAVGIKLHLCKLLLSIGLQLGYSGYSPLPDRNIASGTPNPLPDHFFPQKLHEKKKFWP